MKNVKGNLMSDYHQIILQNDCDFASLESDFIWREEELSSMVWATPKCLLISTARVGYVDVRVTVLEARPELDYSQWDQITECYIDLPSGVVRICGLFDYFPDSPFLAIDKHLYGVFLCFSGLGTVSEDELDGEDSYSIFLWPTDSAIGPKIIKRWSGNGL